MPGQCAEQMPAMVGYSGVIERKDEQRSGRNGSFVIEGGRRDLGLPSHHSGGDGVAGRSDRGRMCPAVRPGRIMIMPTTSQHWTFIPARDVERETDSDDPAPVEESGVLLDDVLGH
jgi:hypothetical protein